MKIKYLAHACFLITSEAATKIMTDPYECGETLKYGEIKESADIVTVSHGHGDHNNVAAVGGNPEVVNQADAVEIKGIKFKGIPTAHDDAGGTLRGKNIIFCFEVDGVKICHLGDLGHQLSDKQVAEFGKVDMLLVPVGGHYTIDAGMATKVCNQIKPKIIIPMHYKTDKLDYPITGVEEFLQGKERERISRLDVSEAEFKKGELPPAAQIVVLKPDLL